MTDEERAERDEHQRQERHKALLVVANHSETAVQFMDLVELLDLEDALEELLLKKPSWRIPVTNARVTPLKELS